MSNFFIAFFDIFHFHFYCLGLSNVSRLESARQLFELVEVLLFDAQKESGKKLTNSSHEKELSPKTYVVNMTELPTEMFLGLALTYVQSLNNSQSAVEMLKCPVVSHCAVVSHCSWAVYYK